MTRPARIFIDTDALLHNLGRVKEYAPLQKIIAMVKANAYGCGLSTVVRALEGKVDAFGVASLEEALAIRAMKCESPCVLMQGVFGADELFEVAQNQLECVIHHAEQVQWILQTPLRQKIKIWIKVDTGMHRLGFLPEEVPDVVGALQICPWIDPQLGLMTHLACADEPANLANQLQIQSFNDISLPDNIHVIRSMANSAAIMALPQTLADVVRPGIMLYGVSPFVDKTSKDLGLKPVMRFVSAISAIHHYPSHSPIGYGGAWHSNNPSIIGVVAVGYGDGYPRGISPHTPTAVNGVIAPIVGRVSMDMLMIDLTHCPNVKIGDEVELWGNVIPVELIARSARTIGYELMCKILPRVRGIANM